MTEEELKQFEALAAKFEPEKEKDVVLKLVQSKLHPVFQEINDGGRAAANLLADQKYKTLETNFTTEKQLREKLEKDLKELDGKAPEVARVREQYDRDLAALRADKENATKSKDEELLAERRDRGVDRVTFFLADLVDPDYARTVLHNDPRVKDRIAINPATGKAGVLKAGTTDTFLTDAGDKTAFELLAEEVAKAVPVKWRRANVNKGSGTEGSQGGGTDQKDVYSEIRKDEKERLEAQQKLRSGSAGLEKLRGVRR